MPVPTAAPAIAHYSVGSDKRGAQARYRQAGIGFLLGFLAGILVVFGIFAQSLQFSPALQGAFFGSFAGAVAGLAIFTVIAYQFS